MRLDSHARPRQLKAESAFGPSPNRREAGSRTLFSSMSPWVRRIDGDSEKLNSPSRLIRRHATLTEICHGKDRRFIDTFIVQNVGFHGTLVSRLSTALSQERGGDEHQTAVLWCATLRAKGRNFATSTGPMIEAEISSPRRRSKNPSSRFDSDV
jgi:hypothetical protein